MLCIPRTTKMLTSTDLSDAKTTIAQLAVWCG